MLHLRYLNQRFIEDIDELMKGHEGMKEMFGGNTVNINQRFEQLEQNYSSIETTNINLTNSLTKLEEKFNRFVENHDTLQQNTITVIIVIIITIVIFVIIKKRYQSTKL